MVGWTGFASGEKLHKNLFTKRPTLVTFHNVIAAVLLVKGVSILYIIVTEDGSKLETMKQMLRYDISLFILNYYDIGLAQALVIPRNS